MVTTDETPRPFDSEEEALEEGHRHGMVLSKNGAKPEQFEAYLFHAIETAPWRRGVEAPHFAEWRRGFLAGYFQRPLPEKS